MSARRNYATCSIGCAGVWGAIFLFAERRSDSQTLNTVRLVCGGWWMGWASAIIGRIGSPAPKQLTPAAEKRLHIVELIGLASPARSAYLQPASDRRAPRRPPETLEPSDTLRAAARPQRSPRRQAEPALLPDKGGSQASPIGRLTVVGRTASGGDRWRGSATVREPRLQRTARTDRARPVLLFSRRGCHRSRTASARWRPGSRR